MGERLCYWFEMRQGSIPEVDGAVLRNTIARSVLVVDLWEEPLERDAG